MPLVAIVPGLTLERAYFEMVSTMTTTGMTSLEPLEALPPAVHLWRAMTAWLGGLAALVAAAAVFNPRNLGGYEVQADMRIGPVGRLAGMPAWAGTGERATADRRLDPAFAAIAPAYTALTVVLGLGFLAGGIPPLQATVQAVGVMSTSGLAVDAEGFRGGVVLEVAALAFMALAATRHAFQQGTALSRLGRLRGDAEVDLAVFAVAVAAGWILLRGAMTVGIENLARDVVHGLEAVWGAVFTTASFLTTTGYVSGFWNASHTRIGLDAPAMLLMALATMGGGVASTAGGVKLLRSFALFQHGVAELRQLGHPSSVTIRRSGVHRVSFSGALLAWLFVMLFLLALGLTAVALSVNGVALDDSLAAAVAALTNTGPVYGTTAGPASLTLEEFGPAGRLILCAAMVVGRVEVLAVVVLANPAYWVR
jgi:trk system potassium uptake protein TrkH